MFICNNISRFCSITIFSSNPNNMQGKMCLRCSMNFSNIYIHLLALLMGTAVLLNPRVSSLIIKLVIKMFSYVCKHENKI